MRRAWLDPVAGLSLVGAITVVVGELNGAFNGFPKGYDAYGHLSKIKLLVDYFPNADWNFEWYSGQLYAQGSFPALFHYLAAVLVGWFHMQAPGALLAIAAAAYVVMTCSLYGLVFVATRDWIASAIAALLAASSSGFWVYVVEGGLYPRIVGMAMVALFALLAILYFRSRSLYAYVGMVLALSGALSSHLLLGAIGVAFGVLLIGSLRVSPRSRLVEAVKLFGPTALVVAYFYVPYALTLTRPAPVPLLTSGYTALSWRALFVPGQPGGQFESLPFFLVPLAVALIGYVLVARRPLAAELRWPAAAMAVGGAGSLLYSFVGLGAPGLFIYNFQPGQALFFASWFLAGLIGLSLATLKPPRAVGMALVGMLLIYTFATAQDVVRGEVNADNAAKRQLMSALPLDAGERQYRVGVSWDAASDWIGARADVPQTRGYQQQGELNADWQYWLEQALWRPAANYDEKNFLLDWFAVKTLYGGPDPAAVSRFEARPDLYRPLAPDLPVADRTFAYVDASPILSAVTTRTALVIGSDAAYTLVVKGIALSGFASSDLIPIRGGQYVDDHSPAELSAFSEVILYGFAAHDSARAMALLAGYVAGGGGLLMEANNSPFETTASAPDPIPGVEVEKTGIGPGWDFQVQAGKILDGVDLSAFAPATYAGGPWGVSYMPTPEVKPWAHPVLLAGGRPVVVAGTLGRGRVVWSGMNLPFHAVDNQAEAESRLLSAEISWAAPDRGATIASSVQFVNPELRSVKLTERATGVIFKENWFGDWKARVNGADAKIYRAGPDFMYVPIGEATKLPADVDFTFSRSALEGFSDVVSALALMALVVLPAVTAVRRKRRVKRSTAK